VRQVSRASRSLHLARPGWIADAPEAQQRLCRHPPPKPCPAQPVHSRCHSTSARISALTPGRMSTVKPGRGLQIIPGAVPVRHWGNNLRGDRRATAPACDCPLVRHRRGPRTASLAPDVTPDPRPLLPTVRRSAAASASCVRSSGEWRPSAAGYTQQACQRWAPLARTTLGYSAPVSPPPSARIVARPCGPSSSANSGDVAVEKWLSEPISSRADAENLRRQGLLSRAPADRCH